MPLIHQNLNGMIVTKKSLISIICIETGVFKETNANQTISEKKTVFLLHLYKLFETSRSKKLIDESSRMCFQCV